MGKSLSNLFCGFWTRVAQKTVFHVCALLAWLSFLLSVCVWMFFLYFLCMCVCVIKFSFICRTFWSLLPSWCRWLWPDEALSKCFLGVQVNCLQMGMEKCGWNLFLGLVTKWGQICYCNWELSIENLAEKVLILIPPLWPPSANRRLSWIFVQCIFMTYFQRYWRPTEKQNLRFSVPLKIRLELGNDYYAYIFFHLTSITMLTLSYHPRGIGYKTPYLIWTQQVSFSCFLSCLFYCVSHSPLPVPLWHPVSWFF